MKSLNLLTVSELLILYIVGVLAYSTLADIWQVRYRVMLLAIVTIVSLHSTTVAAQVAVDSVI